MENKNILLHDNFLKKAIDHHIGDIQNLPAPAQAKIRRVYREFFSAYHKIAMQAQMHTNTDNLEDYRLDPEIVEYMQHFFSDYQGLYHDFTLLNTNTEALLAIDRDVDPAGFRERLDLLMAGKMDLTERKTLTALMGDENTEEI